MANSSTPLSERLKASREAAGYKSASEAARALSVPIGTYTNHENGGRGFKLAAAQTYARRYRVNLQWLLTGTGQRERIARDLKETETRAVPLVGHVSAGQTYYFDDQGNLDEVDAVEGSTEDTVAVEIRGTSLGEVFDRWLAYYDDVQRPVSTDHIGKLCVVGLADGRIMLKKVVKARGKSNTYHLISNTEPPILDVEIEWAARVRLLVQK